jgi:hypothetical protein
MTTKLRRLIASLLVVSISGLGLPLPAQAGMVGTDAVVSSTSGERARIAAFLDREDVRAQLQGQGVSPEDVKARVAALTDEEAAQLAGRIDSLPAGGILGLILLVFVILLITDILGLTKVFPFTRPVR